MRLEGGCYCRQVRFVAEGEPIAKAECLCRECQYISGGGPNFLIVMPADGFAYVQGEAKGFARPDLDRPVTREFCPTCGTHLITRAAQRRQRHRQGRGPGRSQAVRRSGHGLLRQGQAELPRHRRGPDDLRRAARAIAAQGAA
jgi:hypothetical protein